MKALSSKDFWAEFAKRKLLLDKTDTIWLPLNAQLSLDKIFGELTSHRISEMTSKAIDISCINCSYARNGCTLICDGHMGIIQGLFEKEDGRHYNVEKAIIDGICHIKLEYADDEDKS
ncbi:MAG: hypothetical protein V3V99_11165 [candidate division Zixibacteria bacterium]